MSLKIGDVVRLNSGGHDMTVASSENGMAVCCWLDNYGKPQEAVYAEAMLTKVADLAGGGMYSKGT